jgi:hypothetical protein
LYIEFAPCYDWFARLILEIVEKDAELSQEMKRLELKHLREQIPKLLHSLKRKLIQVQGDTKGTFNRDKYEDTHNHLDYEYFEIRHHDKKLYEGQKLKCKRGERKAKPDGWKTCCIIKAEKLSLNVVEQLRKESSLKNRKKK